jgi:5-methylcytosine-specific restriction protein B
MELAYRREQGEQVFVPKNLHVIGTMNLADRSLAIVDMALRRRFSFVTLEPQFNETWRAWCQKSGGLLPDFVTDIAARLASVNQQIAEDRALGEQYCIGHSYFTPAEVSEALDGPRWFTEIVEAEIVPLLQEYWFDDDSKVRSARHALLDGLA